MNTSRKEDNPSQKEPTPRNKQSDSEMSIQAAPTDDVLDPHLDVLAPWDPTGENDTYDIPNADGVSGVGVVHAKVLAWQAAPGIVLGRVQWEIEGVPTIFTDPIQLDIEKYEVNRDLEIPYDLSYDLNVQRRKVLISVWNRWDAGRRFRERFVTYRDRTAPAFEIVLPQNNAQVPLGDLAVSGWAEDRQSGVAAVEWSLDGDSYRAATITPGKRVDWRFEIPNLSSGVHTIALRFRDQKGNQTARDAASVITITATGAFKPKDDLVSLRAYLDDLIEYAKNHVQVGSAKLTDADLVRLFYQPFGSLVETISLSDIPAGNQPVNQLRAAIEVLRQYIAAPVQPLPQPIAYWTFEEGTGATTTDVTGNNNPGTLQGGVSWTTGRFGRGLSFDGVDDFVQINNAPLLEVGKNGADFSVTFHLLLRQGFTGAFRTIMHKGVNNSDRTFALFMQPDSNRIGYAISTTAGNQPRASNGEITLNKWTAIAYVKAGNRVQLYLDGVFDSQIELQQAASVSNVGLIYIGKDPWYPGIQASIDDMRIFDVALRPDQIAALNESSPLMTKLGAYWKFDEGQGNTSADAAGNGHTATLKGLSWSDGRIGKALKFDGVDDVVSVAKPEELTMVSAATICAWINPQGPGTTGAGGIIVGKEGEYEVARFPDGSIRWAFATSQDNFDWINTGCFAPLNQWTHIAVVYDKGKVTTYANGREVHTQSGSGSIRSAAPGVLLIGGKQMKPQYFHGLIDEVRIYRGVLSGSDVASLVYPITEADYRPAVYQALLGRIGASEEELRLARSADEEARKSLASRLGIAADRLESLRLPAATLTEADLERLFGLADSTRDPLTTAEEPSLLVWRREYLQALWRGQDEEETSNAATPIIDPDLIGTADLRLSEPENPAFDLWQARAQWLVERLAELKTLREAQPTPLQGFDAAVGPTLIAKLLELEQRRREGNDIGPELSQLYLTPLSYTRLLRVRKLAENTAPLDADWEDVYNILVQMKKQQRYATWRTEESGKEIALTPQQFQISDAIPEMPRWRATWRARLDWQEKLQARIDQLQATEDALRVAVSAAEEQTLPLLRDALVMDFAEQQGRSASELGDWLVQRLLVDLKTNASQRTTRMIQAIETVQGVLFSLRAGQLAYGHPASSWKLVFPAGQSEGHFDEEWQWLGNYSTWRAAMFVYLFPEAVLLPSLREPYEATKASHPLHRSKQFETLMKELRKKPQLAPEQARLEAGKYLSNLLADLGANLKPDSLRAAIQATKPSSSEDPTFLTNEHTDATLGERQRLCREVFDWHTANNVTVPNHIHEIFYGVPLQLAWQLQKSGAYLAALDWYQTVYAWNLAPGKQKIYCPLEREKNEAPILSRSAHWLTEGLNPHTLASRRVDSNPHTRYTLMSLSRCLLDYADSEFTRDTAESLARARELYLTADRILHLPELETPTIAAENATVLPNPLLDLLRLKVEIQLVKMRQGRNIAGMKRQVELPVALPPGPSDIPTIGAGGQLIIPGTRPTLRPTPYYFRVLLERSKQLVNIAQQIEAAYLAALEKRDAENYNLLKANNDLQLAMEGVELQNRRVNEAQAGVGVAQAQRQRAAVMSERYSMLSSLGLNNFEMQMISSYQQAIGYLRQAGGASSVAALLGGAAAALGAGAAAASALGSWPPNPAAAALHIASGVASLGSAAAQAQAAVYSANAQVAQTQASIAGIYASAEWRQKEFETQAIIAEQDILIGEAQIQAAQAHVGVADQERRIAQTQMTQAQAVADFLAKKFTNAELYEWMSGVLGEVYSYFLQQATAMAQLAENQLAFERQDTPPKFIRADYWEVPSDTGSLTTTDQKTPDRKGLTGSARLLQDIYQLDQYAFETDKRKLNLSQTFSLSRMAPYDFELFRQTGVLTFATPMALFDRDFPGHYLRLIKRVRTSVVALIPPVHGIRATLTATGISRVVTGGDVFQQVVVRRDPELVALTSPISATGVFELDTQSEMLLPFESMGVDTTWEFQMPRAANPFDFRTIADVLVTIEYTALNNYDYRQQVIKTLNPKLSGERSFIFRQQFADQWYDLHNPEQSATPMTVKFKTWREDFPPNLDGLKIEQVLLFFSRVIDEFAEETPFEIEVKSLRFTPQGETIAVGGGAKTIGGVISTRRGNGASWNSMIGKAPAGEWELSFNFNDPEKDKEIRDRFKNEEIDDILLVITYGGRTPAWPA